MALFLPLLPNLQKPLFFMAMRIKITSFTFFSLAATWVASLALLAACQLPSGKTPPHALSPATLSRLFQPLPEAPPALPERIQLGRMLFYDLRLSITQQMSCNTCHLLQNYGVDGLPTSLSHKGRSGPRNTPTVYNAALQSAQFWDGRARSVEEQAGHPLLAETEMGMPTADDVEKTLRSIPGYSTAFAAAFQGQNDPITFQNISLAIATFERGLLTPSRFDRYLAGDLDQLTPEALQGLQTFLDAECAGCHNGVGLGGTLASPAALALLTEPATRSAQTLAVIKIPSLRNVTKTAPYLHDGSVATLEETVARMAPRQAPLTPEAIAQIVVFLGTLTGELPADYIAMPALPEDGPETASFAKTTYP
jgi:cytochrome c peroxidase